MTLYKLQKALVDALNEDALLRRGGCLAMCEDALDYVAEINKQLKTVGGVALVVLTPRATREGYGENANEIPLAVDSLTVAAVEMPAVNRLREGAMTALRAAQRAAIVVDSPTVAFQSFEQVANPDEGSLTVRAVFNVSVTLTEEDTKGE